jgi:hypothetical protein
MWELRDSNPRVAIYGKFQAYCLCPLGQTPSLFMRRMGFEPMTVSRLDLQSNALNLSATFPLILYTKIILLWKSQDSNQGNQNDLII